jgi:hypothetical protein
MAKITVHNSYFNTKPVVFHHHGRPSLAANNEYGGYGFKGDIFKLLSDEPGINAPMFRSRKENRRYFQPPASKIRNPINDKLKVYMVSNLGPGSTAYCMDHFGIHYEVLGQDLEQYSHWAKYELFLDVIQSITHEYTMLIDTDDIFFINDLSHLVDTYAGVMGCDMLHNAEGWYAPKGQPPGFREFEDSVAPLNSPYKYLNGGLWIAKTEFLQGSFYEELKKVDPWNKNDQAVYHTLYPKFYPQVKIDSKCQYFQSTSWSHWLQANYPEANHVYIEGSTITCKSGVAS